MFEWEIKTQQYKKPHHTMSILNYDNDNSKHEKEKFHQIRH
jgi:hypothetical protein